MDSVGQIASAIAKRDTCESDNEYDGRIGVRISAVFVILFAGTMSTLLPLFVRSSRKSSLRDAVFFIAKFFGSGVIVATAFIHLLDPAMEELGDECLGGAWEEYPWALGICMFSIFALFFLELLTVRFASFESFSQPVSSGHTTERDPHTAHVHVHPDQDEEEDAVAGEKQVRSSTASDVESQTPYADSLATQLTALFILEFGVVFHSIFVGLSLATSGSEFNVLYVVIVFHQSFEGLGLGSRLASTQWAPSKRWTPYVMAIAFGITTPIAIAIGLGVRYSYSDSSRNTLISNGIFDSVSAGILLYTGLVELMAHEFLFSRSMREAPFKRVCLAFGVMCCGAGLMALLGRWA
ncbi:Zinc/iron permease [Dipodascopsis tothii]|uniref:Zinc/iron permease n=1 Tax=Dipodascopsis tothii TaxID=44089 RepID=UPI0034CDE0FE